MNMQWFDESSLFDEENGSKIAQMAYFEISMSESRPSIEILKLVASAILHHDSLSDYTCLQAAVLYFWAGDIEAFRDVAKTLDLLHRERGTAILAMFVDLRWREK